MITLKVFNSITGEFQEAAISPEVKGECFIGRGNTCDLVLESSDVSRTHAKIQVKDGKYFFTDLGSANGSSINGQTVEINQACSLRIDDLIRIGDFVLLVEAIDARPKPSEPASISKRSSQAALTPSQDWKEPLKVRCVRITPETPDVKTFTFVADPPVLFKYKPGQFVTLELEINGASVLRSYSLSSSPSRPHTLEITVKRVAPPADAPQQPAGLVSNWLHDTIAIGSQIQISKPLGKFTCVPVAPAAKLLMISAGSGITPVMSMARWLADTAIEADAIFFHCARSPRDIIFRQELEMMSARLSNFHLALSTTQPEFGQAWSGYSGRFTEAMLRCVAPDFLERNVYVCGPDGFMRNTKSLLEGLGFPMQNYAEESFGAPKRSKPQEAPQKAVSPIADDRKTPSVAPLPSPSKPIVLFSKSDKQIAHDGSESVLELAEQAGIKIRSSCRQGVCGACKKRKIDGEVNYEYEPEALEADDRAAGYILTCVASPVGQVTIEA